MIDDKLLKPPRELLIVDDAFDVRAILKEILRSRHIESIDEAADKDTAMEKLRQFNYRLIFLDIDLPDGNGLLILQHVKQLYPKTRVVIISAHNTAQNVRKAVIQGADGFIVKPFCPQKILSLIEKYQCRTRTPEHP